MTNSTLEDGARYVRASNVIATDMDGETVMMDVEKGSYFALSGSGPHMWDNLAQPMQVPDLVEALSERYDTRSVEDLEDIVTEFVISLLDKGLVLKAD